jgi:hypothetical protein
VAQVCVNRARRAEVLACEEAVDQVDQAFDDRQAHDAQVLFDRFSTDGTAWYQLRDMSMGIVWLDSQIEALQKNLADYRGLHPGEKLQICLLAGRKAADIFVDPFVWNVNLLYISMLHGPGSLTAEQVGQILVNERPQDVGEQEYIRRLAPLAQGLIGRDQAREFLGTILKTMRSDLADRLELVEAREARARETAAAKALVDISAEGEKRSRYIARALRGRYAALRELRAMQKERRDHGSGDVPTADGAAAPAVESAGESKANLASDGPPEGPTEAAQTTSSSPLMSASEVGAPEPSGTPHACADPLDGAAAGVPPGSSAAAAAGA